MAVSAPNFSCRATFFCLCFSPPIRFEFVVLLLRWQQRVAPLWFAHHHTQQAQTRCQENVLFVTRCRRRYALTDDGRLHVLNMKSGSVEASVSAHEQVMAAAAAAVMVMVVVMVMVMVMVMMIVSDGK